MADATLRITAIDATRQAFASVGRNLQALDRQAALLRRGFAALAAAGGIGAVFADAVRRATEAERALNRLNATLRATGHSAGLTSVDVQALSRQLARASVFDDDDILSALNALLRFRDVQGQVFRDAARLLPDVASGLGVDLPQAAIALGRALAEPGEGLRALQQAGVRLNESQVQLAKHLRETGDIAGAQRIVLEEVTKSLGGLAAGENQGLYGATRSVGKAWDDLLKTFAGSAQLRSVVVSALDAISGALSAMEQQARRSRGPLEDLKTGAAFLFGGPAGLAARRALSGGAAPTITGNERADIRRIDREFENELRAAQRGQAARRQEQVVEAEAERRRQADKKRRGGGAVADPFGDLVRQLEREKLALREVSRETELLAELEDKRFAKLTAQQRAVLAERAREVDAIRDAQRIIDEQAESDRQATEQALQQARELNQQLAEEAEAHKRITRQAEDEAEALRGLIDPTREFTEQLKRARELAGQGFINPEELAEVESVIGKRMKDALDDANEAARRSARGFDEFKGAVGSAMEEAIVHFDSLRDVVKGLFDDIARIAARRGIVEPIMKAIFGDSSGAGGFDFGKIGAAVGKFFGFARGGIAHGGLQMLAGGAIVSGPTLAVLGEGRRNEAVVPLPDGRSIPVKMAQGGGDVRVTMNVYTQDAGSFQRSRRQLVTDMNRQLAAVRR